MNIHVIACLVLGLVACGDASGDVVPPAPPCEKCTLDVPPSAKTPVPLLVVMHGNHEDAADAARRWRDVALARNWAVLSLHCPRGNGCEDGDENPAHPAAKRLRSYYERCDQEHVWDLLPGANHAREDAALDRERAIKILDWLDQHARRPTVS